MRPVDVVQLLSPLKEAIHDLYVVQGLSLRSVSDRLGKNGKHVYRYLHATGMIRKRKDCKPVYVTRTCKACQQSFQPMGTRTLFCGGCAPDQASRVRWDKYRITKAQFDTMLKDQDNTCAICSCPLSSTSAHVDHDHSDGAVRGLLCRRCNRGIGLFHDDPDVLGRARGYLLRSDRCLQQHGPSPSGKSLVLPGLDPSGP